MIISRIIQASRGVRIARVGGTFNGTITIGSSNGAGRGI